MNRVKTLQAFAAAWNEIWQDFRGLPSEKARKARGNCRRLRRFVENGSGANGIEHPAIVTPESGPKGEHASQGAATAWYTSRTRPRIT